MSNEISNYLNTLEAELQQIQKKIKHEGEKESYIKEESLLNKKINKVKSMIQKNKNTFLIKTSKGYLSSNGKFTDNVNLAYTYKADEAVAKAEQSGGWLEELPS